MKTTPLTELDGRFTGLIGQQYNRLLISMPHLPFIQRAIATSAQEALSKGGTRPSRVLELGCGKGATTLALCEQIANAVIVAIDNEPTMLNPYRELMLQEKAAFEVRGIVVEIHEAEILTFLQSQKAASFDAVVSGETLHNISKDLRPQIMAEIGRVLRPQGRFVNGDKIARDDEKLHQLDLMEQIASYVRCYNNEDDIAFGLGWIEHYVRDNQADLKQTESEVNETLSLAGFGNIRIFERHVMDAVVSADHLA